MCPFIVEKKENPQAGTRYIVLTSPCPEDAVTDSVRQYVHLQQKKTTRILIFDASLGLGELTELISDCVVKNADAVLEKNKAITTMLTSLSEFDIITGYSKKSNIGTLKTSELHLIFQDLKLLGRNYNLVIIYVPASLPLVRDFFCSQLDSLCWVCKKESQLKSAALLLAKYPKMKCYISAPDDGQFYTRLALMVDRTKILTDLCE